VQRFAAFAPASVGNVGPGFDVLGLAVEGIGDHVAIELIDGPVSSIEVTGIDAELVPADPHTNAAAIAAQAYFDKRGMRKRFRMEMRKGIALSAGMVGSGASSVAGALAAAHACSDDPTPIEIMAAALEGETAVAGFHLDNIAASVLGGLALVRSMKPIDAVRLTVNADWRVVLVTPHIRLETKRARALLPRTSERELWIQQMANTAALVHAFATGDGELVRRALDDRYAEPLRASLIPHFATVKKAALDAGAFGCSISGAGPTIFAMADDVHAESASAAMAKAFAEVRVTVHVTRIAQEGARMVEVHE